jgi:23S rRNA (cytidine1920-2'-O)/16S rRNA (cytidine1409-2'-O)-methyltransferase
VMAGRVRVDGRLVTKAGTPTSGDAALEVEQGPAYVSRGGDKLATALAAFAVDVSGLACLDVGASTGGFTDCLLQAVAAHVTALDVGRGQLHERLRSDDRVTLLEGVNARLLAPGDLPGPPAALAVVDVSFISLGLVLGPIASTLRPGPTAPIVALVKPQFEVGKGGTDHGVVRDPEAHRAVLRRVHETAAALGLGIRALIASPILGPEGNREFLVHLQGGPSCAELEERIDEAVAPGPTAAAPSGLAAP